MNRVARIIGYLFLILVVVFLCVFCFNSLTDDRSKEEVKTELLHSIDELKSRVQKIEVDHE